MFVVSEAGETYDARAGELQLGQALGLGKGKRRVLMDATTEVLLFIGLIVAIFALSVVLGSFFTVQTAQVALVQRLGKFARVAGPGLNWKTPLIETVIHRMSMKVQQFDVQVETKTQDNVFVQIPVSIQYKVMPDGVESAFYKLSDPVKQIESMVYNVVLGHVPKMKLDDTFLNQADIANDLRDNLDGSMKEYGYSIVKVLISDIVPDLKVKAAMNDINAARAGSDCVAR
jgi:regulator of protease activity HflC (stomatin/prohibitin superfamily)